MQDKRVSQKTIVALIRALEDHSRPESDVDDFRLFLYEHDFPQWFVTHAQSEYRWDWTDILFAIEKGTFSWVSTFGLTNVSILGNPLGPSEQQKWSDYLTKRLAALATTIPYSGESVRRSLQLDGPSCGRGELANKKTKESRVKEIWFARTRQCSKKPLYPSHPLS